MDDDRQSDIDRAIAQFISGCTAHEEIVGVALMSNQARRSSRTADMFSDIDFALYISLTGADELTAASAREFVDDVQDLLPPWLPAFDFLAPTASGVEVNIYQHVVEYDERPATRWSEARREAYASGYDLLFDRGGRILRLITSKVLWYPSEREKQLAASISRAKWDCEAARTQAKRHEFAAAHGLINASVENVLKATCYLHSVFPPNRKWLWNVASGLPAISPGDLKALTDCLEVQKLTEGDVRRRLDCLEPLLQRLYDAALQDLHADPGDYFNTRVSDDRQLRQVPHDRDRGFHSQERGRASWFLKET